MTITEISNSIFYNVPNWILIAVLSVSTLKCILLSVLLFTDPTFKRKWNLFWDIKKPKHIMDFSDCLDDEGV